MRKVHITHIRFTEEQYYAIKAEAEIRGLSVAEYIRHRVLNGQAEPRLAVTVAYLYNTLQVPYDKWNKPMEENFRKGMAFLYDIENNSTAIQ